MSNESFQPQGNTQLILVSSSTGQAAQQVSTGNTPAAWLANPSTVPVYVAMGTSAIAAGVPTTSTPAVGMCLPAGTGRPFNLGPAPANGWLSAVTSGGAAQLFATPGSGR